MCMQIRWKGGGGDGTAGENGRRKLAAGATLVLVLQNEMQRKEEFILSVSIVNIYVLVAYVCIW